MSYEFPAWCQMQTALEAYQQEREVYLKAEADKLGPDGERRLREFKKVADSIIEGVQDLAGADGIASFAELCNQRNSAGASPFDLLMEHVCIIFGWQVLGMLDTARERFAGLLFLLRDRKPCDRALAFLQRVGRCYLFGFDAESVVMCRAVLDREFEAEIAGDDVESWWRWYKTTDEGKKDKRKSAAHNLWGRIRTARYLERITERTLMAADSVRGRGNDGVHKEPSRADAAEKIEQTIQVLDELAGPTPTASF